MFDPQYCGQLLPASELDGALD